MSPELCTEVSEFVLRNSEKASHVDLIWYGGEPLCAEAEIRQISASLLKDDAFSEKYSAQMVTNGFLLTKELVDTLVAAHINMVQITVDGPDYIHDKKRKLRNGKGTFQTILGNIINCNEKIDISLKINVDKINKPYLLELLDVLASKGLKNKIDIALSPVLSSTNKINSDLLTTQEFAECETAFYHFEIELARIINYPYNSPCSTLSHTEYSEWFLKTYFEYTEDAYSRNRFLLPGKRYSSCTAYMPDDIKIHADGSLALCNAWIPQNRCGNIEWLAMCHSMWPRASAVSPLK